MPLAAMSTRTRFRVHHLCLVVLTVPLLGQDPGRTRALERAAEGLESPQEPRVQPAGEKPTFRLVELSLDLMAAVGTSTERDSVLSDLKGGAHDPKKRGFTLQNAELSLVGAVDPYFTGHLYLITQIDPDEGETIVELEEAYLRSLALPGGLQLKLGTYLTEFGRINDRHPHQWDWQDQPVIHSRVFGGDGMRGPGARLSWLIPSERYLELIVGAQNANGETMASFAANDEFYEERPIGGRFFVENETRALSDMVYNARLLSTFELGEETSLDLGASIAVGPNATGGGGDTLVYGADFVMHWRPETATRGWPFFKLQGEFLARDFDADEQVDDSDPLNPVTLPGETLQDYGGYLQGLYGFAENWAAGLRVELATGSGDSYDADSQSFGRDSDPYRTDRMRISPMLAYHPSEYSRIRIQYDYDESDHLEDDVHSIWLGFEILIGAHPPHSY